VGEKRALTARLRLEYIATFASRLVAPGRLGSSIARRGSKSYTHVPALASLLGRMIALQFTKRGHIPAHHRRPRPIVLFPLIAPLVLCFSSLDAVRGPHRLLALLSANFQK
jgi:hypothetical protein